MFNYICVMCLCLQGSWPQSVQPICYYDYVQVCVFPVPVFTGQLATKFTAYVIMIMFKYVCVLCLCLHCSWPQVCNPYVIINLFKYVCVLCLCLQGSWPQSVQPARSHNYVQVCVSCACVYRAFGHKVYSKYYYNYVQVCLCPVPVFTW